MDIKFEHLSRSYKKVKALHEFTAHLPAGSTVGLVGNNGSGKTTLVKLLCNLMPPHSGRILIDGKPLEPRFVSYRQRMGIVLSEPYYVEAFSVKEYWRFVAKFQQVPKDLVETRMEDLLRLFELEEHADKPIVKLSSGNQMKVSLGAALIHNPEVLVLDEPFVNLDIRTTETLMQVLASFKGKKTLFLTSHNLERVADLCEDFLILDRGQLVMEVHKGDFSGREAFLQSLRQGLGQSASAKDLAWLREADV